MSERTGLGPLELAVLRAVAATPDAADGYRATTAVLGRVEEQDGVSPSYVYPVLRDLGASWCVHLRLLDHEGNWGNGSGDPPADARYTALHLSLLGELALASERGDVGPVPIGLVDGTLYRGGRVPPLDPHRVVDAVTALVSDPELADRRVLELLGAPALPTGGTVGGDLDALYAGETARLHLGCRIEREQTRLGPALVITGTPLGVALDELERTLDMRARNGSRDDGRSAVDGSASVGPSAGRLVRKINDESSMYVGTRVVVIAVPGADLNELERWVHGVWPVTIEVECRLPAPAATLLRRSADACRADRSGLDRLAALLP